MRRKNLKYLVTLIFVAFSCSGINSENLTVSLNKYYPRHTLVQLKDLNKHVQEYFMEKYPNSHPACIKEDFDGDGVADYALILRTKIKGKITERLVVLKGKDDKEFIPINLDDSQERIGDCYLRRIPPGKIEHHAGEETVTIDRPGFEEILFESASRAYFWKSGKFHYIQTSD